MSDDRVPVAKEEVPGSGTAGVIYPNDGRGYNRVPFDPMVELANKGLFRPLGFSREEFLPQLRGRKAAEIYREMWENDSIVGAMVFAIEMILRQVQWDVEPTATGPNGEVTDDDIERADFLKSCMDDMNVPWEEFVAEALTMLVFGFSFFEVVYKKRVGPTELDPAARSNNLDGKIGWRKFMLLPQESIAVWRMDDTGGIQGAEQQIYSSARTYIPIEKALLFRTTKRSTTGRSVLRSAYLSWYRKKRIEEIEGIGVERDLAGLPVLYLDPDILGDAGRLAEYQEIVRNIRRDDQEGVILPQIIDPESKMKMVELTLLSSGGARQFDTDTIVDRYSRYIAMTLLQDVVLMGHEKVGTQGLASEKRDLSDTALQAWLNEIANTLNMHAVPRLFELNGMDPANLPKFVPGDLHPTDVKDFAQSILWAAQAGFQLAGDPEVENFVRRRLGLPQMPNESQQAMADRMIEPTPNSAPGEPAPTGDMTADQRAAHQTALTGQAATQTTGMSEASANPPAPGQPADPANSAGYSDTSVYGQQATAAPKRGRGGKMPPTN